MCERCDEFKGYTQIARELVSEGKLDKALRLILLQLDALRNVICQHEVQEYTGGDGTL